MASDEFFSNEGGQIALQFDGSTASTLSHRFLWNPAAIDQLLADETVTSLSTAGTVLWTLADHLGTIQDLASHNSSTHATTIDNHRTYDSYGNVASETNSAVDEIFGFTGRLLDDQTGLQNNLNRWFDSDTGLWLTDDPIGFRGDSSNPVRYAGNDPVRRTDPTGEDWLDTTANFCAGWGDTLSLNTTNWIRSKIGINDGIDHQGTAYRVGVVTGAAHIAALGAAAGASALAARAGAGGGGGLLHLTSSGGRAGIGATGQIIGKHGIFALPESVAAQGAVLRMIRSGLPLSRVAQSVRIPQAANCLFRRPMPIGPYSLWKYVAGVRFAPPGSINVVTGAFTPVSSLVGPSALIYRTDGAIYAVSGGVIYALSE
jgi:RHS repeat-associated protein